MPEGAIAHLNYTTLVPCCASQMRFLNSWGYYYRAKTVVFLSNACVSYESETRIVLGNIAKTRHDTMNQLQFSKRTLPLVPVGHPNFKWTSGADVQATWHRYTGWIPPSGNWLKPIENPADTRLHDHRAPAFLRVK